MFIYDSFGLPLLFNWGLIVCKIDYGQPSPVFCLARHPVAGDAAPASSPGAAAAEKADLSSEPSAGVTPSPKGFSFASI